MLSRARHPRKEVGRWTVRPGEARCARLAGAALAVLLSALAGCGDDLGDVPARHGEPSPPTSTVSPELARAANDPHVALIAAFSELGQVVRVVEAATDDAPAPRTATSADAGSLPSASPEPAAAPVTVGRPACPPAPSKRRVP
jgi:hypothetical protein